MFPYIVLSSLVTIYLICKIYRNYLSGMCKCETDMTNKTIIITGANTGIGFEAAKDLARRGAKVIIACRNEEKGNKAKDIIINTTGNENVIFKRLDLCSFKCIRDFTNDILKTESKLHILVNNAGTGKLDNSLTEDDLPIEAQVNYFGPFLLTMLLLPLLKASTPSRIINVSSVMHKFGKMDLNRFHKQTECSWQHMRVYSDTKLGNILFTKKLSGLLQDTGVTANSLHPGAVATDIFRNRSSQMRFLLKLVLKTPWEGAQTTIHLAVSEDLQNVSGKYFADCREAKVSKAAEDSALVDGLWELSNRIVGISEKNIDPTNKYSQNVISH